MFQASYVLAKDPPAAANWDGYQQPLAGQLANLISSGANESALQEFLEANPCLVPGASGLDMASLSDGHFLFSQPPLPGIERPIPDFMWICRNSEALIPVLVEIEDPSKPHFTAGGQQHHQLTQALGQLTDWKVWLQARNNVETFLDLYRLNTWRNLTFSPLFVLVYGRRQELADPRLAKKRDALRSDDVIIMTWDRLTPQWQAVDAITVRPIKRDWRVVSVPPTFRIGPEFALSMDPVTGFEDALRRADMSKERRDFLEGRLQYWRDWAVDHRGPLVLSGRTNE